MNKITLITYVYEQSGGTKTVIDGIAKTYIERGFICTVLAVNSPVGDIAFASGTNTNLNVIYLNPRGEFNVLHTLQVFNAHIKNIDPNICFFFLGNPFLNFLFCALTPLYRSRAILYYLDPWFTFQGLKDDVRKPVQQFIRIRDQLLSNNSDSVYSVFSKTRSLDSIIGSDVYTKELYEGTYGIIVCSTDMHSFFVDRLEIPQEKVALIPLYIDGFCSPESVLTTNTPVPTFIYSNRVSSSWKGFGLVLEALQNVLEFQLHIFTWDNTEVALCKELFKKYKLNPDFLVFHVGKSTEELKSAMRLCSAVLIPSIAEGFSYTMLESMSVGAITIMGALYGGPKDVIKDNVNGLWFEPGSSKGLYAAMVRAISLTADQRLTLGKQAASTASEYSYTRYIKTLSEFINLSAIDEKASI